MIKRFLKNTILLSSLGHLMVFGLFSFSFDQKGMVRPDPPMFFWGQILPESFLKSGDTASVDPRAVKEKLSAVLPAAEGREDLPSREYSLKPQVDLPFSGVKNDFMTEKDIIPNMPQSKDSPIMFHPLLPYQLQIYFKDRQAVHIELMFNIASGKGKSAVLIKRKVSSGNLEADLLSLRYINHYLFIQQARFPRNTWQTVRIDLSNANDQP